MYSVHDRAINIKDDNDYRLISIVDRRADLTGLSVLVPRLPTGTVRGQAVMISEDQLSLLAGPVGPGTKVSLRTSGSLRVFSGSIADSTAVGFRVAVCSRLPLIRDAVLAHGSPHGLREVCPGTIATAPGRDRSVPRAASEFVRRAVEVVDAIGASGPPIDLSGLVGLGIGFTPSGDDFIMGFLAAGAAASFSGTRVDIEAVRGRLRGTTLGGATLLRLALDGSFPAYMCEFVDELRAAEHTEPGQAVIRAVRHGESSGTDALAGFVCGLTMICAAEKLDE